MITTHTTARTEYVFRHARVWLLARSAPAVVALLLIIALAVAFNTMVPLLLALLPLALLVRLILRHYTETVSVAPCGLVVSTGAFGVQSVSIPFWRLHVESRQPLIGRMFNYGTIRILFDGVWYELHGVGAFTILRALIAQRQAEQAIAHVHGVEMAVTHRSKT